MTVFVQHNAASKIGKLEHSIVVYIISLKNSSQYDFKHLHQHIRVAVTDYTNTSASPCAMRRAVS